MRLGLCDILLQVAQEYIDFSLLLPQEFYELQLKEV